MTREAMLAKAPVPRRTFIPFRPTALLTTRRDATSGRCRRPTALQRLIRNARFSMSRCSGLVPMGTPHHCCLESRC